MTKNAQLTLIDTPRSWRLDERTREVGREGVARAREALRAGLHPGTAGPPDRPPGHGSGAGRPSRGVPGHRGGGPRRAAA
jgi:hypothetical protein